MNYLSSILALVLLLSVSPVFAKDDVDYLSLSALMIKEGEYIKALEALDKVKVAEKKREDVKRYYTLKGIASLKRELYKNSIAAFNMAIEKGQKDPVFQFYLAQAYFGLKEYDQAIARLEGTGELQNTMPGVWQLKAQIYWDQGKKSASWQTLTEAEARFPDQSSFTRRKVFVLIQMGLFKEASVLGATYLSSTDAESRDYIAIGEALRRSGEPVAALKFLELARFKFNREKDLYLAMVQAYMDLDQFYTAAQLMEEAGRLDSALLIDAAELYRRSGHADRALYINSQINDQKEKLKQRLMLLLEPGYYDRIITIRDDLYRTGLLEDQNIKYAVGYAYFQTGDYEKTEELLQEITDTNLLRKAAELRKSMESCQSDPSSCY